jgi:DNA polymerase III delta prime subunit
MTGEEVYQCWYSKYRPTSVDKVVGNKEAVKTLTSWINSFQNPKEQVETPIVYMYGPGGVGKSLIAELLLGGRDRHILQMNAGDIRSKKRIQEMLEKLLSNKSIDMMKKKEYLQQQHSKKKIVSDSWQVAIIMDDIDGMSCGDKGGLHELFAVVEQQLKNFQTYVPVICISTKPYDKKVPKQLIKEILLEYPSLEEIQLFLENIVDKEALRNKINSDELSQLILASGLNIRKCLIYLEELKDTNSLTYESFRSESIDLNLFEVTDSVYSMPLKIHQIYKIYNFDTNLVPMMIHENILKQISLCTNLSSQQKWNTYFHFIKLMCQGDIFTRQMQGLSGQKNISNCITSLLYCFDINRMMTSSSITKKQGGDKKIVFTNSLSKSATQSSTHGQVCTISLKLNTSPRYFYSIFHYIYSFMKNKLFLSNFKKLDDSELDKMIQIYQKWTGIKFTIKEKNKIKFEIFGGSMKINSSSTVP